MLEHVPLLLLLIARFDNLNTHTVRFSAVRRRPLDACTSDGVEFAHGKDVASKAFSGRLAKCKEGQRSTGSILLRCWEWCNGGYI
jgi:hypothetical protein